MRTPVRRPRPREPGGLLSLLSEHRAAMQVTVDAIAWAFGLLFGVLVRYGFIDIDRLNPGGLAAVVLLAAVAQAITGVLTGLYLGRRRFGSFEEVAVLAPTTALVATFLATAILAHDWAYRGPDELRLVPLGGVLAGAVAAFVIMGAARYGWRLSMERRRRPAGEDCSRLLVMGAGEGGELAIKSMMRNPDSPYLPVGLIDDDPAKRHLRIKGVKVVGTRADIAAAARALDADGLLIAIPSAGGELVRELSAAAAEADLQVRVLPPVTELLDGTVDVSDIRPVTEADLLGRREIDTDVSAIAGYLAGKRVLVTGAGGSIGAELCRQIHRFGPGELIMLDRDESALHAVLLSLNGRAMMDAPEVVLADIRDRPRLEQVFTERRPQVVFHAAALKHVTALEQHPCEAVKTNVVGTLHLLEVAASHGVERFVNISTDKAADPVNVLGYTKRVAERLTAHVARQNHGTYLSVRFGNVLGSRGSVLTVFREQVAAGGPVTVSDPDVTRYFMTVEEAVQLVIQAGAVGGDGQALVLDMGTPVRIADVAHRLAETSPDPVEIIYTGLRPGEKLHEHLFGRAEADQRPAHPLISHVDVPPMCPETLVDLDTTLERDKLVATLRELSVNGHDLSGWNPTSPA